MQQRRDWRHVGCGCWSLWHRVVAATAAAQESPAQWIARIFDPATLGITPFPGAELNRKQSVDAIVLERGGDKRIAIFIMPLDQLKAAADHFAKQFGVQPDGDRRRQPVRGLHVRFHRRQDDRRRREARRLARRRQPRRSSSTARARSPWSTSRRSPNDDSSASRPVTAAHCAGRRPPNRVVVHYHEVALKRGNRPAFVNQLMNNIGAALRGTGVKRVRSAPGRIVVQPQAGRRLAGDQPAPAVGLRHRQLLAGLAHARAPSTTSRRWRWPPSTAAASAASRSAPSAPTRASRCESPEISRIVGAAVQGAQRRRRRSQASGAGDQRRGAAARGVRLGRSAARAGRLAGGQQRDGAGAALRRHRLAGRGVAHDAARLPRRVRPLPRRAVSGPQQPRQGRRAGAAADALPAALAAAPGDLRRDPAADRHRRPAPVPRRALPPHDDAHRRSTRAARIGAAALVTGESLGQVASQTLANMTTVEAATTLPLLRPLIGMDKAEISAQAERIGTLRDLDPARPGLLPALRPEAPGDAHERQHARRRRSSRSTSRP